MDVVRKLLHHVSLPLCEHLAQIRNLFPHHVEAIYGIFNKPNLAFSLRVLLRNHSASGDKRIELLLQLPLYLAIRFFEIRYNLRNLRRCGRGQQLVFRFLVKLLCLAQNGVSDLDCNRGRCSDTDSEIRTGYFTQQFGSRLKVDIADRDAALHYKHQWCQCFQR